VWNFNLEFLAYCCYNIISDWENTMKYWSNIRTTMVEGIGDLHKVTLYSNDKDGVLVERVCFCQNLEHARRVAAFWVKEPEVCRTLIYGV
jgi:hypothetical protein